MGTLGAVTVTCPVCGEELEREEIADHEHEIPAAWEEAGGGFECPEDGLLFDTEEELVRHQATEHG
jgi:hypothetical protein